MRRSRTKNVFLNSSIGIVCQIINFLLNFITRTVFVKTLGAEYLGINGLFGNVLALLSFAELGIGNAVVFNLYKPLAENNTEKTKSLMNLYKTSYTVVFFVVTVIGLSFVPFLKFLIKGEIHITESLIIIYLIFLFDTASSYLLVYKKSMLIADQKNYLVVLINECVHIVQVIGQIIVIICTKNYYLFLVISVGSTLLRNVIAYIAVNRIYPYLKEPAQKISSEERKGVFRNVRDLSFYKFGSVILNGTDNILISTLSNLANVGLASNYILITSSCNLILGRIEESFISSVGNLNVSSPAEKKYDIFKKTVFVSYWIYGFATCGVVILSNEFIINWLGVSFTLDILTVIAIASGFYFSGIHNPAFIFRTTSGFFKEGRFSPVVSAVINIILSVVFYKILGLSGIFFATPISIIVSMGVVDIVLIYRKAFFKKLFKYYLTNFIGVLLMAILTIICYYCCAIVSLSGWVGFFAKLVIITVVYNSLMLVFLFKSSEFKELFNIIKRLFRKAL